MASEAVSTFDRLLAGVCVNCPACRQARRKQSGLAYSLVKSVEQKICPFCRAYERVHGRKSYEPATPPKWSKLTTMKSAIANTARLLFICALLLSDNIFTTPVPAMDVGLAVRDISPPLPIRTAGYAARKNPPPNRTPRSCSRPSL